MRGYSTEAVIDTILRRMPDYVNYICPQFTRTHVNFQRVPTVDTSNPFIARDDPDARREHGGDPLRRSEGHRLPVPAVMLHDSFMSRANTHRRAGRQDGAGDAADLHADHLAPDGAASRKPKRCSDAPGARTHERTCPMHSRAADPQRRAPRGSPTRMRALAMDAVEQAKSGHPGMPMGMAEIAVVLWTRPSAAQPGAIPHWPDRDRFVLSNGHGSMLLYALLHLTGYDLPIDELQALPPAALEDARAIPKSASRPASRRRPVRSARASPTRSAWRSPSSCSPPSSTAPATRSSTTAPMCSSATAA